MNLYDEFFSIINVFEKNDVKYAVIGGIALAFHDIPRFTKDIDILIKPSDLEKVADILEELNFFKSTDPHKFLNANLTLHRFVKTEEGDHLVLDILAGKDKVFGKILNNAEQAPWEKGHVAIASRKDLIWLKKLRNSDQDKTDIKKLSGDEEQNEN